MTMLPPPGARLVFLHAHPDDETLATGVLISWLSAQGYPLAVVTATRGEQGEVRPALRLEEPLALARHREGELAAALAELGVSDHAFLGSPPARAAGRAPRVYADSGMRWLDAAETVAGPSGEAGPTCLTAASIREAAADLAAYLTGFGADLLLSYDLNGGYGHPDHVACHHIARAAAQSARVGLREIVSEPLLPQPGAQAYALPDQLGRVQRALGCYASQLEVDGDHVIHVGGQRQPITTTVHLARPWP